MELFVGIDVSKAVLDIAIHPTKEAWSVANSTEGVSPPAKLSVSWRIDLAPGGGRTFPPGVVIYGSGSVDGPWTPLPDSYLNAGFSTASVERLEYVFIGYPFALDPPYCVAP